MSLTASPNGPFVLSTMVSSWSREGVIGRHPASVTAGSPSSATYDATQRAFYFPVDLPTAGIAYKFWWLNGATASTNNFQVGVYADTGAYKPGAAIIRGTSTTASGANTVQFDDIADTVIPRGLVWLAIWGSGTTATLFRVGNRSWRSIRWYEESSLASGLPSTATPVKPTNVYIPVFGIQFRSAP